MLSEFVSSDACIDRVQHVKRNAWLHALCVRQKVEVEDERREIVNQGLRAIWTHVIKPSG